jgi:hypothetical protein
MAAMSVWRLFPIENECMQGRLFVRTFATNMPRPASALGQFRTMLGLTSRYKSLICSTPYGTDRWQAGCILPATPCLV